MVCNETWGNDAAVCIVTYLRKPIVAVWAMPAPTRERIGLNYTLCFASTARSRVVDLWSTAGGNVYQFCCDFPPCGAVLRYSITS